MLLVWFLPLVCNFKTNNHEKSNPSHPLILPILPLWCLQSYQSISQFKEHGFCLNILAEFSKYTWIDHEIMMVMVFCWASFIPFLSQDWHLARGDFLCGVPPSHSVSMMNQMSNIIVKALKNFHCKEDIQAVLVEGLKFCVAWFVKYLIMHWVQVAFKGNH